MKALMRQRVSGITARRVASVRVAVLLELLWIVTWGLLMACSPAPEIQDALFLGM